MAYYYPEPSHTFNEYLLVPGFSSGECIPSAVSLETPLVRYRKGEAPAISLKIPMVSAIMQSVSGEKLAIALAREGGVVYLPELVRQSVGIGVVLKVRHVLCVRPFTGQKLYLGCHVAGRIAGSRIGAENAAAGAF